MLLLFLLVEIVITIHVVKMVVKLFATRNEPPKGGDAPPWSDRLYSAAKRASLTWTAEILFCLVAYAGIGFFDTRLVPGKFHYWIMVTVPSVAFAWGVIGPRRYEDGIDRVKNGRRRAWVSLAIFLFFLFTPVFFITRAPMRIWFNANPETIEISASGWNCWRFRNARVAADMIPWDADEITFTYRAPVLLSLGGSAELRCHVEKEDLLAFAKARGYEFQSESISRNACKNGCGDCDFIHIVWEKFNRFAVCSKDAHSSSEWEVSPYPEDFLAYNYRYKTCGGFSFLYDVATKTLYACWSSN